MSSGTTNTLFASLALAFALQVYAPPASAAEIVDVHIDQAKIVELPDSAVTVVIGNPLIVDLTMLKTSGKMVLTGKGYGETNLIAVNKDGVSVGESLVRVTALGNNLIVQRGVERESYTCNPRCQPTVALGDASRFMTEAAGQITSHSAAAGAGAAALTPRQQCLATAARQRQRKS